MRDKIVDAAEAVAIIQSGDTVAFSGFVGIGTPDEIIKALEYRFLQTQEPRDLTLVFAAAPGDGEERGLNRLAHAGLIKRLVGGHYRLVPKLAQMAVDNQVEAYNLPLGCISHLFREIAGGRAGLLSKVGLGTFVDPALGGGKLNSRTTEDLVRTMEIDGEQWLFYKTFPINVAVVRGTTGDRNGNISMEREALTIDNLAIATAAKNSKGFVVAQVERIAAAGSLNSRQVKIPSVFVDCVVVAESKNHLQTYGTEYSGVYSGQFRAPEDRNLPMKLSNRKIIARRCAMELPMGGIVNLGIGMPEGVASVAAEEKLFEHVTLTAEPGIVGGVPQGGLDFGAAVNAEAIIDQNQMFDFYDGGGLDLACLGLAQVNSRGDVNVSLFNDRLAGAGGFINITQSARRLIFAGTFTSHGLKTKIGDGGIEILTEGKFSKFVDTIGHVTFSGRLASDKGQPVLYVTERCVFQLTVDGLELKEVAKGIDIDRDILAHMGFRPIISDPKPMNPRLFGEDPMQLDERLLNRPVAERLSYDERRNTLFLGLEGYRVQKPADIEAIREGILSIFRTAGRRFGAIINYDSSDISPAMSEAWFAMAADVERTCYTHASRYTTSAFMRLKLGDALSRRNVAAHIFETSVEAHKFIIE